MTRPFGFSSEIKRRAFQRQRGRCAVCGDNLAEVEDRAHHVIPVQSGRRRTVGGEWMASEDNCVYLCHMCHDIVHEGGRFGTGAMAPPDYFRYSHGRDRAGHAAWAARVKPWFWD